VKGMCGMRPATTCIPSRILYGSTWGELLDGCWNLP